MFFSKLFTCLQYEGDSHQRGSVEATYVTLQDGLNFPTTIRLLGSSALVTGRVAQLVGHLAGKSEVLGSIPGLATYFHFFLVGWLAWV